MAGKGPQPLPNAVLALRGSWRAGSTANDPKSLSVAPAAPAWLTESARQVWPQIAQVLVGMGLMATEYTLALGLLCDAVAVWVKLSAVLENDTGCDFQLLKAESDARRQVALLCRDFGLNPSAIKGVQVNRKEIDPLDEFRNPD